MSTFTVAHPVHGKPVELKNRLLPEHIKVGRLLWFDGLLTVSSWSCPAVITKVHPEHRTFQVRSLDDFKELEDQFDFAVDESSCFTRQTMRLVDNSDVIAYLKRQQGHLNSVVSCTGQAHDSAKAAAATFADAVAELGLHAKATS